MPISVQLGVRPFPFLLHTGRKAAHSWEMSMFVNLTPHDIVVRIDGVDHTIPKSGRVSRVISPDDREPGLTEHFPHIRYFTNPDGGEITEIGQAEYGDREDAIYLVAAPVLSAAKTSKGWANNLWLDHRLFAPGTGPNDGAIRNDKGQIEAVTCLVR